MAKGARASVRKANNVRLKNQVFGPVEIARTERLSAKLLELAAQPKPKPAEDSLIETGEDNARSKAVDPAETKSAEAMDVDEDSAKPTASKSGRVEKKRRHKSSRKASIVFPKYKDRHVGRKVNSKKIKRNDY